jgi:hypothetical protein
LNQPLLTVDSEENPPIAYSRLAHAGPVRERRGQARIEWVLSELVEAVLKADAKLRVCPKKHFDSFIG